MRTLPAFLIAPLPAALIATVLGTLSQSESAPIMSPMLFLLIFVTVSWVTMSVLGIPIVLLLRRWEWNGWLSYAVGGAVMVTIANSPISLRMVFVIAELAHRDRRLAEMMILVFLRSFAIFALYGALTGLLFRRLTRDNERGRLDLDDLNRRFE